MRSLILSLAVLTVIGLTSCEKRDWGKKGWKTNGKCGCNICQKGSYKEYIYESLVTSDDCDCIVAGKVKYVAGCGTESLLDYGNGTCDNIAIKTICVDGNCDLAKGAYTVEVTLDCAGVAVE